MDHSKSCFLSLVFVVWGLSHRRSTDTKPRGLSYLDLCFSALSNQTARVGASSTIASNLLRLLSVSNLRHTLGIRIGCVTLDDSQTLCLLNLQQSLLRQSDARMSLPRRRHSTRDPSLLSSTDAKAMTKLLDAVFSGLVAREKLKSTGMWRGEVHMITRTRSRTARGNGVHRPVFEGGTQSFQGQLCR